LVCIIIIITYCIVNNLSNTALDDDDYNFKTNINNRISKKETYFEDSNKINDCRNDKLINLKKMAGLKIFFFKL
jgi:hypothetical protein